MSAQHWPSLDKLDIRGKRLLIREDFNVPCDQGQITDTSRIERALPSIKTALSKGAAVLLCSHFSRPKEGSWDNTYSLDLVAKVLSARLGQPVRLVKDYLDGVDLQPGEVALCENVRFNVGETANDETLSKRLAALCDVFVMDAFATAHRAQASTVGVAKYAKQACFGPLMMEELTALGRAFEQPQRPLVAVVGGSKVSTKIQLLESLLTKVDTLIVGGGIANTFLKAQGHPIGTSLFEADFVSLAQSILKQAQALNVSMPLPTDLSVATTFSSDAEARHASVSDVHADEMILDVGPETAATYAAMMQQAGTVVWNGPVGVFEFGAFANGTQALGEAIANSGGFTLAGGGDTLAALAKFQLADRISYVSTGGGAFLSYLQGETLPAVEVIQNKENHYVR